MPVRDPAPDRRPRLSSFLARLLGRKATREGDARVEGYVAPHSHEVERPEEDG